MSVYDCFSYPNRIINHLSHTGNRKVGRPGELRCNHRGVSFLYLYWGCAASKIRRVPRALIRVVPVFSWVTSRILLLLFALRQEESLGDVKYYAAGLRDEAAGQRALIEYPDVSVWPLRLIGELTADERSFVIGFAGFCLLLDAAFCWWLVRQRAWVAYGFWLSFGLLLGPIFVTRLDLLPGLLVATAAIWISRNQRLAAALLGVATAVKLWPLALATGLVGHWRSRGTWRRLAWWGGSLVMLALITAATSGWWRVISPLQYQTDRGLQSETVLATPFVWLARFHSHWNIEYADSQSFEVFGTGVVAALLVSTGLSLLVAAFGLWETARRFLVTGEPAPGTARAYWLVLALLIVVTAKVFSPQYLMWVAPLVAVMLALDVPRGAHRGDARAQLRNHWQLPSIGVLLLLSAALSTYVFPLAFDDFIADRPALGPVAALTVRNILMLATTVIALQWYRSARAADLLAGPADASPTGESVRLSGEPVGRR